MCDERITLIDNNIKFISDYAIDSIIGYGGSSIIYKCHSKKISQKYYIIKELFPLALGIKRNDKGFLVVPEASNELWSAYKNNALSEIDKTADIGTDGENNDDFVFQIVDKFEANNTIYTVIETSSGYSLSDEIEYCDTIPEENADIISILVFIKKILNTLSVIHSKGYLHLDISPDNIYISNGTDILRLIDYNSSLKLEDVKSSLGLFSFKHGYSAPELENRDILKTDIGVYTDLYSVCAIFYRMLCGKTITTDVIALKNWGLHTSKFCDNLSDASISLIEKVFDKGFKNYKKIRFQSCEELMQAIENIENSCLKQPLKSLVLSPSPLFVGRKKEIDSIDDAIHNSNFIFVSGMAGIGKSELVRKYVSLKSKEYESIYFCSYKDSLKQVVASMRFYQDKHNQCKTLENAYNDNIGKLEKLNEDTLVIVDDFNLSIKELKNLFKDDSFIALTQNRVKLIFITRNHIEHPNFINVESLSADDCLSVFKANYTFNKEDENSINYIIEKTGRNTYLMVFVSKLLSNGNLLLDDCVAVLKSHEFYSLDQSAEIWKDGTYSTVNIQSCLHSLIDVTDLSDNDVYLLKNLYCIHSDGIDLKMFVDLTAQENAVALKSLILKGYVEYDTSTRIVKLHPLMASYVYENIVATGNDFTILARNIVSKYTLMTDSRTNYDTVKNQMLSIASKIFAISDEYIDLIFTILNASDYEFYSEDIIKIGIRAADLIENYDFDDGYDKILIAKIGVIVGEKYQDLGMQWKAKECFDYSMEWLSEVGELYGEEAANLWIAYYWYYYDSGQYETCFQVLNMLKRVTNDSEIINSFYKFITAQNISTAESNENYNEKLSIELIKLEQLTTEYGENSENLYDIYIEIGTIYQELNHVNDAAYYYKKAYEVSQRSTKNKAMACSLFAACYHQKNCVELDADMTSFMVSYLDKNLSHDISFEEIIMSINFINLVIHDKIPNKMLSRKILEIMLNMHDCFANPKYLDFLERRNYNIYDIEFYIMLLYKNIEDKHGCVIFANKTIESISKAEVSMLDKIRTIFICNYIMGIANYYTHFNFIKAISCSSIQFIRDIFSCKKRDA